GATVRAFSSDDQPPQPDLSKVAIAPEWSAAPQTLGAGAGAHRLVWDLHYAPPAGLTAEDPDEPEEGVWAPPGEYRLELKAGGRVYRQLLAVVPDPRITVPPAAYARQFALARDVEGARVEVAAALAAAERIHAAIAERRKGAGTATAGTATAGTATAGTATAGALAAADARLLAISDLAPEKRSPDSIGRPPTTTAGLRYLAAAFHSLGRAVDGADAAPTADAERGYARHRALLERTLAEWKRFTSTDLAGLNAQLKASGAAVIAP
ncbi:MAG TPA: hypothetical protein VH135_04085, partial [Steroidobacteraceae bacterium]|nr:hypothetical protein [Steroidobacteraceae bacterium]